MNQEKPKFVNINVILSNYSNNLSLAENHIKDLLLGEICVWYTKTNVIKNMIISSVEIDESLQVYLNGFTVNKEMKIEIVDSQKEKNNNNYIVGFPSGEVIFLKTEQIEKLKKENLIKYSNMPDYYGFVFYFNDVNYHNIKTSLDSNYKKLSKSKIDPRTNYSIGDVIICQGSANMLDVEDRIGTIRDMVKDPKENKYCYLIEYLFNFNKMLHDGKGKGYGNFWWIKSNNIKGVYTGDIDMHLRLKKYNDLEEHEIDDEYHIKNLFNKNNSNEKMKEYQVSLKSIKLNENDFTGENNNNVFSIGDVVILKGVVDNRDIDGMSGLIEQISQRTRLGTNVFNDEIVETYIYDGPAYRIQFIELEYSWWWVSPHNVKHAKNLKRLRRDDIDPYGEENWGWEEI